MADFRDGLEPAQTWRVRSGVLAGAATLIEELGADPVSVCRASRVPLHALTEGDFPLPGAQVIEFLEQAARQSGDESFGIRLGWRQTLAVLGPVWLLLESAATVGELLRDLAKYFSLHTRGAAVTAKSTPHGMRITYSVMAGLPMKDVQTIELGFALLCKELRPLAPRGWEPARMEFRHGAPRSLKLHRLAFGQRLAFNQPENALIIQPDLLAIRLATGSPDKHRHIEHALVHASTADPKDLILHVEEIVRAMLPYSDCTVAQVAIALNLSERTLQRRLLDVGESFVAVRDRVRADLACRFLRQSALAQSEIADILGYSDVTAFSRAFRRWYGMPPGRSGSQEAEPPGSRQARRSKRT
jgi:AraC-like DNA-binding protein